MATSLLSLPIDPAEHIGLVRTYIDRMKLPPTVDRRDLMQEGWFGLVRASEKYDPERGKFATLAMIHIRRAVVDHLRCLSKQQGFGIETGGENVSTASLDIIDTSEDRCIMRDRHREAVSSMLRYLPHQVRLLVRRNKLEGIGVDELAERYRLERTQVVHLIRLGMKMLAVRYGDEWRDMMKASDT